MKVVPRTTRAGVLSTGLTVAVALVGFAGSASAATKQQGASATAASASAVVSQDKKIVGAYSKAPAPLPLTPLSKPVPAKKLASLVTCSNAVCTPYTQGLEAATDALGWTYKNVVTDDTPQGLVSAWKSALQVKPAAIVSVGGGVPFNIVTPQMQAAKKAGIPISVSGPGTYPIGGSSPVVGATGGPAQWAQDGKLISSEVVATAGPKPNVVYVEDSAFPGYFPVTVAVKKMIPAAGGTVSVLQAPLSGLGTQDDQLIVSYLRSHPQTNAVVLAIDDYTEGLSAALAAAGLTDKVKLYGSFAITTSLAEVQSGLLTATILQEDAVGGWRALDQDVRSMIGQHNPDPAPAGAAEIVTKANVAAAMKINFETFPYKNQTAMANAFKAAWHIH